MSAFFVIEFVSFYLKKVNGSKAGLRDFCNIKMSFFDRWRVVGWSILYTVYMVVLKVICFSGSVLTVVKFKAPGSKECKHILDILWGQPIKLVHVLNLDHSSQEL